MRYKEVPGSLTHTLVHIDLAQQDPSVRMTRVIIPTAVPVDQHSDFQLAQVGTTSRAPCFLK